MGKLAMNIVRFLLGTMYLLGGSIKIERIGKTFAPTVFGHMSDAFAASHRVLSIDKILTPMKFQEVVGYTEMICGFMLLIGQLMALSATVLMMINFGAMYALYLLDQPFYTLASTFSLFVGLVSFVIVLRSNKKEKKS